MPGQIMAYNSSIWTSSDFQRDETVTQDFPAIGWKETPSTQSQIIMDNLATDLEETAMDFFYNDSDWFTDYAIHNIIQGNLQNAVLPPTPTQPLVEASLRIPPQSSQAEMMVDPLEVQHNFYQDINLQNCDSEAPDDNGILENFTDMVPETTRPSGPMMSKRTRFSRTQTMVLQAWIDSHLDHPYPTVREFEELRKGTDLDLPQIRNWFSRYRHRKLILPPSSTIEPFHEGTAEVAESSLDVVPTDTRDDSSDRISNNSMSSARSFGQGGHNMGVEPLAPYADNKLSWWIRCLPTDLDDFVATVMEPISHPPTISHPWTCDMDIRNQFTPPQIPRARALRISIDDSELNPASKRLSDNIDVSSENGRSASGRSAFSGYTVNSGRSVLSRYTVRSQQSANSATSSASAYSSSSFGPRKGRRRAASFGPIKRHQSPDSHIGRFRPYECRFCGKPFSLKSTCKRHERAIHQPVCTWICGQLRMSDGKCFFCTNLSYAGFGPYSSCPHNIESCDFRPEGQVTFYRCDNFTQHLRGVHNLSADQIRIIGVARWSRRTEKPASKLPTDPDDSRYIGHNASSRINSDKSTVNGPPFGMNQAPVILDGVLPYTSVEPNSSSNPMQLRDFDFNSPSFVEPYVDVPQLEFRSQTRIAPKRATSRLKKRIPQSESRPQAKTMPKRAITRLKTWATKVLA